MSIGDGDNPGELPSHWAEVGMTTPAERELSPTFNLRLQALLPVTPLDRQPIVHVANPANRMLGTLCHSHETSTSYTLFIDFVEALASAAIAEDLDMYEPGMPKLATDIDLDELSELVDRSKFGSYIERVYTNMTVDQRATADMSAAILNCFGAKALCAPWATVESMINSFDVPLSKQHHTHRLHAGMLVTASLLGTDAHSDESDDSNDEPPRDLQ